MGEKRIASEEDREKYAKILKNNGIESEVKEVIFEEPNLKGEHMCTACEYVTIKFADGKENLELFIKKPFNNEMHIQFISEMKVFEKESTFFNSFLPDTRKFCEEKTGNSNLMKFFPKSYYGDESLIVLENLVPRNYFMLDKEERQDFDQAKIVLQNMARFHGVSYVYINEMGLEKFNEKYPYVTKESFYRPEATDTMAPSFEIHIVNCIRILKTCEVDGAQESIDWLSQFLENKFYALLCDSVVSQPNDAFLVLNHGDCWNNNMMFLRDNETRELIDHLFIDMQILRYGSPNLDISYFLFTSVKPEVRQQHLTDFLRVYLDTFKETVQTLGSSVNTSHEDFVSDYKRKCTMGFFMGLTFLSAVGAMKEMNMEEMGTDMNEAKEYFNNILKKWFEDHPEKGKTTSRSIIDQIKEYRALIG